MTVLSDRRAALRFLMAAGTALSASCGWPPREGSAQMSENLNEAWNSPSNVEAASRRPPPIHLGDLKSSAAALSPDGALTAVTLPTSPVNELAIIDHAARRGWVLSHPNYRVKLAHPTFSPDGGSVAVVVTPPTYYGVSEIWIVPVGGGIAHVVSERPSG